MARLPIMPVATDALMADTAHLTMEEFGTYCMILFATWRNNGKPLPDDDKAMAALARVAYARYVAQLKPRLTQFFDLSEGYWRQKRLEKTWESTLKISDSYRHRAIKRWEAKRLKDKDGGDAVAYAGLMQPKPNLLKSKSLNISEGGKRQSGAVPVAPATPGSSPSGTASATLGPDEAVWRNRLRWFAEDPASWLGSWGPPPTDPRCWLLVTPDCLPYQPLLTEAGITPCAEPGALDPGQTTEPTHTTPQGQKPNLQVVSHGLSLEQRCWDYLMAHGSSDERLAFAKLLDAPDGIPHDLLDSIAERMETAC